LLTSVVSSNKTELKIVVPELSCTICHVNRMQVAQDNSGTTKSWYSTDDVV
jgi:hypothetical protein